MNRIGLDGRFLRVRRGIGIYVYELLRAYALRDDDFHITVYVDHDSALQYIPADPRFLARKLKPGFYPFWEQFALPRAARSDKVDVLHCTGNTGPISTDLAPPVVLTVHDVMFLVPKEIVPAPTTVSHRAQRMYYTQVVPRAARNAAAIVTDSEHSKLDIVCYLHAPSEKVSVCHLAPRSGLRRSSPLAVELTKQKYKISGDYFLALGASDPRKNSLQIIAAYAHLRRTHRSNVRLVMCGFDDAGLNRITAAAHEEISDGVTLLPYVPDADLADLLSGCFCFIYVSRYEGFGLPLVEAMVCGAAIICGKGGSLPEIAGPAALYVDAASTESLTKAMEVVCDKPQVLTDLQIHGREHVRLYSWDKTAAQMFGVYERFC